VSTHEFFQKLEISGGKGEQTVGEEFLGRSCKACHCGFLDTLVSEVVVGHALCSCMKYTHTIEGGQVYIWDVFAGSTSVCKCRYEEECTLSVGYAMVKASAQKETSRYKVGLHQDSRDRTRGLRDMWHRAEKDLTKRK